MTQQIFKLSEMNVSTQSREYGGHRELGFESQILTGGKRAGVQLVTLRCGNRSVDVLPTRGMGIWQAFHNDVRFGWNSPIDGPVHPNWVPLNEASGLGWLEGFDELLVRCGLSSNGAPELEENGTLKWPLHGRIANLPANDVTITIDQGTSTVAVTGTVNESRFLFHRWQLQSTIRLTQNSEEIEIVDRVTNLSDRPGSFQLLYHCNFGPPVLESGSMFYAPVSQVTPRDSQAMAGMENWREYAPPTPGFAEEVFFVELPANGQGRVSALVANADHSLAASVRYKNQNLPCFTLWKNTAPEADGYVTGLEPGTNYPNPRSIEEQAGRTVQVPPGETVEFELAIGMFVGKDRVETAIAEHQTM